MQSQKEEQKLNKRERYKTRLKPMEYFKELENLDFENLAEGDKFFLQDFGIFTTDFLEPIEEDFSHSTSAIAKKLWTIDVENPTYKLSIDRVRFR